MVYVCPSLTNSIKIIRVYVIKTIIILFKVD